MATIKEYLDYAELAQASYSNLNNGMSNTYFNQQYKEALITGDFTSIQATDFPRSQVKLGNAYINKIIN